MTTEKPPDLQSESMGVRGADSVVPVQSKSESLKTGEVII